MELCQDPQTEFALRESPGASRINHIFRVHGHTILFEEEAAQTIDEVGQRSHERLFPELTEVSAEQAALSTSQSGIGYRSSVDVARPAHSGALIAAKPRILDMIRGVNNAPHRERFATSHTQDFLACGSSCCEANRVPLETLFCHSRASFLIRIRRGLIFHLFHFLDASPLYFHHLTMMNNHLIHAQEDGLVDWPYEVRLQDTCECIEDPSSPLSSLPPLGLGAPEYSVDWVPSRTLPVFH